VACHVLRILTTLWALLLVCVTPTAGFADPPAASAPRYSIALIIDDLGNQRLPGESVIDLPGPVACAFLPDARHTPSLASQAHARNKEVMLHLPMQAASHGPAMPGELRLDMGRRAFMDTLRAGIEAVPHLSGINNHRGSLLTRHPGHMAWLMEVIRERGSLFFVDSRTTAATVAQQLAGEFGVPNIERKVFLDNERDSRAIAAQFRRLLDIARRDGTALGIGHPYPETLALLRHELARLDRYNIELVPVGSLIEIANRGTPTWQASLSR
jgi:polysaccharide deacetylase 2 family uncharacterized protein YibQ